MSNKDHKPQFEFGDRALIIKDVREGLAEGASKNGAVGVYQRRTAVGVSLFLAGKHVTDTTIAEYEAPATHEQTHLASEYTFYPDAESVPRPIPHKFAIPIMTPVIVFEDGAEIMGAECFWTKLEEGDNPVKEYWIHSRLFDKQVELSERANQVEAAYGEAIALLNREGEEYREQIVRAAEEMFNGDHGTFVIEVGKPAPAMEDQHAAENAVSV